MKRSPGIISIAIVMFIGSALNILFWGFSILQFALKGTQHLQSDGRVGPPLAGTSISMLIVVAAVYAGIGALGIATGIGLLRLRNWARITTIVFAGFGISVVLSAMAILLLVPIPVPAGVSPDSVRLAKMGMSLAAAIPTSIFLWWLVYLNLPSAKAQFLEKSREEIRSLRPLGIAIIGWVMVVGGGFGVPSALMNMPTFIGPRLITGRTSELWRILIAVVTSVVGIALLKLRRWAYWSTIALFIWFLVQSTIVWSTPNLISPITPVLGAETYRFSLVALQKMMRWILAASMLLNVLAVYILIAKRRAFFAASDAADSAPLPTETGVSS